MVKVMFSSGSQAWANNLNDLRERWHIRREEPVTFVVPVALFKQDVQNLQREDLLQLKADLIKLLNDGKKELWKHQNIKRTEGIYLEADKYSDLFFTIQAISTHLQEVNHALSMERQKRHEVRTANNNIFLEHFRDICRERLSKEQYLEFIREANFRAYGKSEL